MGEARENSDCEAPPASREEAGGRREPRGLLAVAIALPLLVQLVMLLWLPRDVFWITDQGNRFIQVQSLLRGRVAPPAVEYPGRFLDPELRFLPDGGVHFLRRNGAVVSLYPPYFAWLVTPLVAAWGTWGLYVVPMVAAAGCLVVFGLLLTELGVRRWRWLGVLALGLGSPLLFYGVTFWEHTTAVLLVLGSLFLLLSGVRRERAVPVLLAGVLLGLSTVLREEGYLLVIAMTAAGYVAWRRLKPPLLLGIGWLATMVPLWLLQRVFYGSWLGLHGALYEHLERHLGVLARIWEEAQDAWFYVLRLDARPWVAAVLLVPLVLLVVGPRRWRTGALVAGGIAAAVAIGLAMFAPDPVGGVLDTQALLLHTPLLLVVVAAAGSLWRTGPPARLALVVTTVYTALAVVALHRQAVGIVWGPRHFLPIIPLIVGLAILAAERADGVARGRVWKVVVIALVAVSVAFQLQGLRVLAWKKEASASVLTALRHTGKTPVVTDVFWLAEEAAELYYTRPFFFVRGDADLAGLIARCEGSGDRRVVVVLGKRYRLLSPRTRAALRRRAVASERVRSEKAGLMDVDVLVVPLAFGPPSASGRAGVHRSHSERRPGE